MCSVRVQPEPGSLCSGSRGAFGRFTAGKVTLQNWDRTVAKQQLESGLMEGFGAVPLLDIKVYLTVNPVTDVIIVIVIDVKASLGVLKMSMLVNVDVSTLSGECDLSGRHHTDLENRLRVKERD